ncbi:MAG TPA: DUF1931 family protein [Methylomirabilota bacterium]|nr:DUF1931 family protein [Methylomirabilota bacterium]
MESREHLESAVDYGSGWVRAFLNRASGLTFDDAQEAQITALAERKLVDLFDRAGEVAIANGRERILHHDLAPSMSWCGPRCPA